MVETHGLASVKTQLYGAKPKLWEIQWFCCVRVVSARVLDKYCLLIALSEGLLDFPCNCLVMLFFEIQILIHLLRNMT